MVVRCVYACVAMSDHVVFFADVQWLMDDDDDADDDYDDDDDNDDDDDDDNDSDTDCGVVSFCHHRTIVNKHHTLEN